MHWVKDSAAAVKMRPKIPELTSHQTMLWTMKAPHRSVEIHGLVVSDRQGQSRDIKLRFFTGAWAGQTSRTWEDLRAFALWPCKQQVGQQQSERPTGHRETKDIGNSLRPKQSRAGEGGKINGHWIFREELSKWQHGTEIWTVLFIKIMRGILWGKTRADPYEL